jgi:hypothetical protein
MPKVLLINGVCNFDHIRTFTYEMQYAFECLGCTTGMLDTGRPLTTAVVSQKLRELAPDFIFSFNATGCQLQREPGVALESETCPFFTFMVDDPSFHVHWLEFLRRPHVRVSFCTNQAILQARSLGIDPGHCTRLLLAAPPAALVPEAERCHDVLFCGAIADPERIKENIQRSVPPQIFRLFEMLSELWLADLEQPAHELLNHLLAELGLDLPPEQRKQLDPVLLGNANRYIRNHERLRIMRQFAALPLTIFGKGWRELLPGAKCKFLPELPYYKSHEELCRAKVALNVQPLSVWGVGERAFDATVNGVPLATTRNPLLDSLFERGREYLPYALDADALDAAAADIAALLADRARREAMAAAAREKALAAHTWEHRARAVLELMLPNAEQTAA